MSVRWPRVLTPTHLSQIISNQKNPLIALQLFNEAKNKYPSYCHNGPVYATMIDILGRSAKINEMRDVIDQMKHDSCECKDSVFATAIKTYAKAGLLNDAISLFCNLPQFNCINWTKSFNTLLLAMVKESKLAEAQPLFLENSHGWQVKSRIRSLNLLMDALCQMDRSDLALQVFSEIDYQGCCPDRDSYRILMKGLCKDKRLNEAIHLLYAMFWRISQKGSGEDIVIYRILLDALCDNGLVEQALEILSKILRKGLKSPKSCRHQLDLNQCNSYGDIEATKCLINEALIKGVVPSLSCYTAMAVDLYSEGKISQGDKVMVQMQDRGFRPTLLTYKAKVAALCKEGKIVEALDVIEVEMKGHCLPDIALYNILLKGLSHSGNSALAVEYLKKKTKRVGCVANEKTYCILVRGLCQDGQFVDASRVLEEMLIKAYRPPLEIYNRLIVGLCSIGRQYEAVMWLEEMISRGEFPQNNVWGSLVSSVCCKCNAHDIILEVSKIDGISPEID